MVTDPLQILALIISCFGCLGLFAGTIMLFFDFADWLERRSIPSGVIVLILATIVICIAFALYLLSKV